MILIEFILLSMEIVLVEPFKLLARLIIWLVTARDCKHCDWSYENRYGRVVCCKHSEEIGECENSIYRKHFKRGR